MFLSALETKSNLVFKKNNNSLSFLPRLLSKCCNNDTAHLLQNNVSTAIHLLEELLNMHIFSKNGVLYLNYHYLELKYNCNRSIIKSLIVMFKEAGLIRARKIYGLSDASETAQYDSLHAVSLDIIKIMKYSSS